MDATSPGYGGYLAALVLGAGWLLYLGATLPASAITGAISVDVLDQIREPLASLMVLSLVAIMTASPVRLRTLRSPSGKLYAGALAIYIASLGNLCFGYWKFQQRTVIRTDDAGSKGCWVVIARSGDDLKVWHADHGVGYIDKIHVPGGAVTIGNANLLDLARQAALDRSLRLPECGGEIAGAMSPRENRHRFR